MHNFTHNLERIYGKLKMEGLLKYGLYHFWLQQKKKFGQMISISQCEVWKSKTGFYML